MKDRKHLVILKGLNKVKTEGWKGMKLNISYIGNFNDKMFGIANKKITPQDAIQINFAPFNNEKLNSINKIKFSKKNFRELHLIENIHSRNRIRLFEEVMRAKLLPECIHNQFAKKGALSSMNNLSICTEYHHKLKYYSLSCDHHLLKLSDKLTKNSKKNIAEGKNKTECYYDKPISKIVSPDIGLNYNKKDYPLRKNKQKIALPFINFRHYEFEEDKQNE